MAAAAAAAAQRRRPGALRRALYGVMFLALKCARLLSSVYPVYRHRLRNRVRAQPSNASATRDEAAHGRQRRASPPISRGPSRRAADDDPMLFAPHAKTRSKKPARVVAKKNSASAAPAKMPGKDGGKAKPLTKPKTGPKVSARVMRSRARIAARARAAPCAAARGANNLLRALLSSAPRKLQDYSEEDKAFLEKCVMLAGFREERGAALPQAFRRCAPVRTAPCQRRLLLSLSPPPPPSQEARRGEGDQGGCGKAGR